MKLTITAVCLALASIACSGDDGGSAPAPSPPPSASLIGRGLTMAAGESIRVGFTPFSGAARAIVDFSPRDAVIDLCGITDAAAPVPERSDCVRDVRAGVRETVTAGGLRGLVIVLRSEQRVEADLVVEYEEGERAITIALPAVPAPPGGQDCSDNACNPFFELQPTRAGTFTARATWDGPDAQLVLLQGSVLGRSQTATGIPYGEPARDEGSSPLTIETRLTAPAEYALALRHTRAGTTISPLRAILLEITWPS